MSLEARLAKLENLIRSLNAKLSTTRGEAATPTAHATSHSPGGSDTLDTFYATTSHEHAHTAITSNAANGAVILSDGSNLSSDATNLFFSPTSQRLGIGTNAPAVRLHIRDGASGGAAPDVTDNIVVEASDSTNYLNFSGGASQTQGMLFSDGVRARGIIQYRHNGDHLDFYNAGAFRFNIDSNANFGFGTSSYGTNAANVIAIASGTAPTSNVANVAQVYVDTDGIIKYRDDAGGVHTLGTAGTTETFGASTGSTVKIYETAGDNGGDFTTTSTSYVKVTDANVSFTATASAKQMVWVTGTWNQSTVGNLLWNTTSIGGSTGVEHSRNGNTANYDEIFANTDIRTGLAAGSQAFELWVKVDAGTGTIRNSSSRIWHIMVLETTE